MKALLNICSGLDVHKEIIEVCILKGDSSDDVNFVRASFSTLRGDLFKLRDFLILLSIKRATSVHEILPLSAK